MRVPNACRMRLEEKPMNASDTRDLGALADKLFEERIRPTLRPEDHGKFLAIDVDTGDFALDRDDYQATEILGRRRPDASMWLMRVGYPAAHRIGGSWEMDCQ
jgi:hypothetical protein